MKNQRNNRGSILQEILEVKDEMADKPVQQRTQSHHNHPDFTQHKFMNTRSPKEDNV